MVKAQKKPITIKAAVWWAQTSIKNQYSGKYQIDLAHLTDAAVEALQGLGIEPRNKGDDRGYFITCRSHYPIKLYDKDGDEIPSDVLIGNGSRAVAQVSSFTWKSGEGVSPDLKRINILDIVEYAPPVLDEDEAL